MHRGWHEYTHEYITRRWHVISAVEPLMLVGAVAMSAELQSNERLSETLLNVGTIRRHAWSPAKISMQSMAFLGPSTFYM